MKEILYILLDNYAEHEIGFMPGAVSTDATSIRKEPSILTRWYLTNSCVQLVASVLRSSANILKGSMVL
jgi:hypothetical protein